MTTCSGTYTAAPPQHNTPDRTELQPSVKVCNILVMDKLMHTHKQTNTYVRGVEEVKVRGLNGGITCGWTTVTECR